MRHFLGIEIKKGKYMFNFFSYKIGLEESTSLNFWFFRLNQ
jgi:hypothetical protein